MTSHAVSPYGGTPTPARSWREMWRDPWVRYPILFALVGFAADVSQLAGM